MFISALYAAPAMTQSQLQDAVSRHAKTLGDAAVIVKIHRSERDLVAMAGYTNREKKTPIRRDTPLPIGSATKVFVGVALFQLIESGKLTLDTKIAVFFPKGKIRNLANYKGKNYWDEITVGMLLNHTSGMIDYLNVYGDDKKAIEIYAKQGDNYTFEKLIDLSLNFGDANFQPGTQFKYCNTGYILLGEIIRKVSGEDWRDYLQKHILDRVGMKHTWFGTRLTQAQLKMLPQGYYEGNATTMPFTLASSAGEIITTIDDLNRFIDAWGKGMFYRKLQTLQLQLTQGFHRMSPKITNVSYGYAIMRIDDLYGHGGQTFGFQAFMATDPKKEVCFVAQVNDAEGAAMQLVFQLADTGYRYADLNDTKR